MRIETIPRVCVCPGGAPCPRSWMCLDGANWHRLNTIRAFVVSSPQLIFSHLFVYHLGTFQVCSLLSSLTQYNFILFVYFFVWKIRGFLCGDKAKKSWKHFYFANKFCKKFLNFWHFADISESNLSHCCCCCCCVLGHVCVCVPACLPLFAELVLNFRPLVSFFSISPP